jgi:hypothetical protein
LTRPSATNVHCWKPWLNDRRTGNRLFIDTYTTRLGESQWDHASGGHTAYVITHVARFELISAGEPQGKGHTVPSLSIERS